MKKRFIKSLIAVVLFICTFLLPKKSYSQSDSCSLQISLLTCTPGEELYSSFGHSAIRVKNTVTNIDIVFNYGTFNFEDPDFYKKFVQGKLLYFVSIDQFADFMYEYEYFKRGVTEQLLNLTCNEKDSLLNGLYENAKEENRYYKYDFNYDNCTTRLYEMIKKYSQSPLIIKNILPHKNLTFRNQIYEYLDKGGQYWSKLGIDILLGAPLDKKVTNEEAMFLPDYLMKGYDSSTRENQPFVIQKKELLPYTGNQSKNIIFKPLVVFVILFLIIAAMSLSKNKIITKSIKTFDVIFYILCGIIGVLLLYMWFGTDHAMCKNNYNLLWAFPLHFIMAFFILSKNEISRKYFRLNAFLMLLLIISWFFLAQQLNIALLPIAGISLIRSFFISKQKKHE